MQAKMDEKLIEELDESNFPFTMKVTKDEKKWNEMLAIPNPTQETFPHILRPCGSYPSGHPLNTIEGKLLFLGAPKEIFENLTQTQSTQSHLDSTGVKTESDYESNSAYYSAGSQMDHESTLSTKAESELDSISTQAIRSVVKSIPSAESIEKKLKLNKPTSTRLMSDMAVFSPSSDSDQQKQQPRRRSRKLAPKSPSTMSE